MVITPCVMACDGPQRVQKFLLRAFPFEILRGGAEWKKNMVGGAGGGSAKK